jgi:hypothetical protein
MHAMADRPGTDDQAFSLGDAVTDSLQFFFCVVVLAATGAATVRQLLPNAPAYAKDRQDLEAVAWMFSTGGVLLLTLMVFMLG